MLGDSLAQVVKDTTQEVSEYLTQADLLEQIVNLNNSYNGHMNLLLIIFGLGIALGGVLVPLYVSFKQKNDFRDLEKKFTEDLNSLKKELKVEIEEEYNVKIKEKTKELENKIKNEIKILQYESNYSTFFLQAIVMTDARRNEKAINSYLNSYLYGLLLKSNSRVNDVRTNMIKLFERGIRIKETDINSNRGLSYIEYKELVNKIIKDNINLRKINKEFLETISNMIEK